MMAFSQRNSADSILAFSKWYRASAGAFSEVSSSVGDFGDVARLSEVNSICGSEDDAGGRLSSVGPLLKEQGMRRQEMQDMEDMSSNMQDMPGPPGEAARL